MNAASVSRQLGRLGFRTVAPSDRNRQGLKVRNSGDRVWVSADLDSDRESRALAAEVRDALVGAGYEVAPVTSPTSVYVTGRASTATAAAAGWTGETLYAQWASAIPCPREWAELHGLERAPWDALADHLN